MATPAWARTRLLANDDVEVMVGRGRLGNSWHKTVIFERLWTLLQGIDYWQYHACRMVRSLYRVKYIIKVIPYNKNSKILYFKK